MSPRQTRRGTIRQTHNTEVNNHDTNTVVDEIISKNGQYETRRQTRNCKSVLNEDEQEAKRSKSTKKRKGEQSKIEKGRNKSDSTLSNSDDSTLKYGLPECNQELRSRPKLPNKIDNRNDLVKPTAQKLDVTYTPEMPSVKQTNGDDVYSPTVTPKSSPIVVNLTPHRTTKTPRKSPDNLASPKTHSKAPQRLSKTPRKLSISVNSPAQPEKSTMPKYEDRSSESDKGMSSNTSLDTASTGVSSRSKKKKKVVSLKSSAIRRFSKSPKIVLRSPKTKARKSKSPKAIRGIGKISAKKGTPQQKRGSPLSSPKSKLAHITTEIITNGDSVMLSKLTPVQMAAFNNKPRIVLEKLSLPNEEMTKFSTDNTSSGHMIKTPVAHILTYGAESPKRPKSTAKKRSSVIESDTPLRPIPTPKGSVSKEHIRKESLSTANTTLTQLSHVESLPILSSTPRDKIRRLLNLTDSPRLEKSPDLKGSPTIRKSKKENSPRASKAGVTDTSKCIRIEDVSQPFVDLSDDRLLEDSDANSTYEIRRGNASKTENNTNDLDNDTYEVLEPKTPSLQQKSKKRNTTDANLSGEHEHTKRVCRVRFASPVPQTNDSIKKFTSIITNAGSVTPRNKASYTSTPNTRSRRRSHSTTDVDVEKRITGASHSKRRSVSSSRINTKMSNIKKEQGTPGNKSINRSNGVSTEKKSSKTPLARKVPNFAQIHQKKFAEMESISEAKNRVQKRHLTLTSVQSHPKPLLDHKKGDLPTSTRNGVYNRFGFKIKKDDAKDIVLKKQPVQKMKSKQEENRAFIKGVRMNRRFELQMKSRNIKL